MTDAPDSPEPPQGPPESFRADLAQPKKRGWLKWLWLSVLALMIAVCIGAVAGWTHVKREYLADLPPIPDQASLYIAKRTPGVRFLDRSGQLIATRGPRFGDRTALSDLPPHVVRAFLAAEDRRYYEHGALDYKGLGRAAWVNFRAKRVVQGGSTITQQLAKDLFLTPERSLKRKVQEAALAYRLEERFTKDQILELYLNRLFFGANTYGVDGAARTYFGKSARELNLGEAALLAALPKAPSRMALTRGMPQALRRARLVLATMADAGWITPSEAQNALAEPPALAAGPVLGEGDFGYALDYAAAEVARLVPPDSPALVVRLTIDSALQAEAAQALRAEIDRRGRALGATQGALVSLAPDGSIRAMVGGLDYAQSPFNRAAQARRQPGSTFKAFVFAAALEAGAQPTDVKLDEAVKVGDWEPENYGGGHAGPVTLEAALARSINTVSVMLTQEIGADAVGALARRFGLRTIPDHPNLSISLGAYEVTLLQLTSAFQEFQNGGGRVEPHLIDEIRTIAGDRLYAQPPPLTSHDYDTARAGQMLRMLKAVVDRGTGTKAKFDWPAAGKTGTSQEWRDAWFIGFTPELATGVWVGDDGGKPMAKVTGGDIPAIVWRSFMTQAHAGLAVRDFDWLGLDETEAVRDQAREAFYATLASEFDRAAVLAGAEAGPAETPEPAEAADDAAPQ